MLHRKDVVIAVGGTLTRLGRLGITFTSITLVVLKIEQHLWLQHTMEKQDV